MPQIQETFTDSGEYILLNGGGFGMMPFSRMVFRGFQDLAGSGAGDTYDARLTLQLPSNNVWQLSQWFAYIEPVSGTANSIAVGTWEMYYAPSTIAFGESTQLNYPVQLLADTNPLSGQASYPLTLGRADSTVDAGFTVNDPFSLITYNDESGGADPTLWLGGEGNTAVPAATLRYAMTFYGYTYEQMDNAELHVGLMQRGGK